MNLETKITIYKFTPQVFTLTLYFSEIGFYMIFHNRVPLNVLTTNIR